MKIGKFTWIVLAGVVMMVVVSGCISEQQYNDLKAQNRIQQDRIAELENDLGNAQLSLSQMIKRLETLQSLSGADAGSKDAAIAALQVDINKKTALIKKIQAQLLRSGAVLPPELNVMLQDFAEGNDMVAFDEKSGVLKFESDLLFTPGSDIVKAKSAVAIKSLCGILNTTQGSQFDIIIAGHTDNVPIKASRAKHPTNWHLSVHRSISVLNVMASGGISSKRLSVRGFGEFRPAVENKPGKKGTSENRRVEVFIVPSGA